MPVGDHERDRYFESPLFPLTTAWSNPFHFHQPSTNATIADVVPDDASGWGLV